MEFHGASAQNLTSSSRTGEVAIVLALVPSRFRKILPQLAETWLPQRTRFSTHSTFMAQKQGRIPSSCSNPSHAHRAFCLVLVLDTLRTVSRYVWHTVSPEIPAEHASAGDFSTITGRTVS